MSPKIREPDEISEFIREWWEHGGIWKPVPASDRRTAEDLHIYDSDKNKMLARLIREREAAREASRG